MIGRCLSLTCTKIVCILIAHEHFGLSLSVIWEIVQTDLPHLDGQLAALLATER